MSFSSTVNLSSLNGTTGFRLNGASAGDSSGISVASAGDVNGDGFADVIVGAYLADPNGSSSGASYVVFGRSSGWSSSINLSSLNGTTGFRLEGVSADDRSGFSVASAGDVNGDGFADLIVGAFQADPGVSNSGSTYVVFGKASGWDSTINLSTLNGTTGFRLDGVAAADESGNSVASAGDVNGDGFADLIVGAFQADPGVSNSGSTYVVFGKASGWDSTINLSTLNGTSGFRLDGSVQESSGYSVASAGDVNGDGFADLIVGANFAAPNGSASGSSYVVFGKSSGWNSSINLSSLNGTTGFRLDGVSANDSSGTSVASAGDVNGDGYGDVIVGAYQADPNGGDSGSSYVVFGRSGGWSSTINLSTLNGTTGFRLDGVAANHNSGKAVASAGDVDGDGFADLIVGALGANPNGIFLAGASYVVFGKSAGWSSTINFSTLNGTTGFRLDGVAVVNQAGVSVASAGDVDGDGFADLIVGANNAAPNGGGSGASYVYFSPDTGAATYRGTSLADVLRGTPVNDVMNGNGQNDRLIGNAGNDTINGGAGDDTIDGGAGNDTLTYASSTGNTTVSLALTTAQNTGGAGTDTISNFENLLGGAGNDSLTGDGGNNTILGNAGNDTIGGGAGDDTIDGGVGDDLLDGGAGNDTLSYASSSAGVAIALSVADQAVEGGTDIVSNFENILGGAGDDTLIGDGGNNVVQGGAGNDSLSGSAGDDTIEGGAGDDTLRGFGGTDTLTYASATAGITISLALTTAQNTGGAGTDTLSTIENLIGGAGNDSLTGSTAANAINGAAGDDTIDGGAGNDTLDGGVGIDTLSYASAITGVTVSLALTTAQDTGGAGTDTVSNFENLTGGGGNDRLTGDGGNNRITGGLGNDSIDGGAGNDTALLSGTQGAYRFGVRDGVVIASGADGLDQFVNVESFQWGNTAAVSIASLQSAPGNTGLVYAKLGDAAAGYILPEAYSGPVQGLVNQQLGGTGNDIMLGTGLADFLNGGAGDDALDGGAGNDVIDGGLGSNFLTGGAGRDIFFVDGRGAATANTWSTITDYTAGEQVTIWGYRPGVSNSIWVASDGVTGYRGATQHWDLDGNGLIDTSVTFTGLTQAALPTPSFGTVSGQDYILFG